MAKSFWSEKEQRLVTVAKSNPVTDTIACHFRAARRLPTRTARSWLGCLHPRHQRRLSDECSGEKFGGVQLASAKHPPAG